MGEQVSTMICRKIKRICILYISQFSILLILIYAAYNPSRPPPRIRAPAFTSLPEAPYELSCLAPVIITEILRHFIQPFVFL